MAVALTGPPELERLDFLTISIRDDHPWRAQGLPWRAAPLAKRSPPRSGDGGVSPPAPVQALAQSRASPARTLRPHHPHRGLACGRETAIPARTKLAAIMVAAPRERAGSPSAGDDPGLLAGSHMGPVAVPAGLRNLTRPRPPHQMGERSRFECLSVRFLRRSDPVVLRECRARHDLRPFVFVCLWPHRVGVLSLRLL